MRPCTTAACSLPRRIPGSTQRSAVPSSFDADATELTGGRRRFVDDAPLRVQLPDPQCRCTATGHPGLRLQLFAGSPAVVRWLGALVGASVHVAGHYRWTTSPAIFKPRVMPRRSTTSGAQAT